MQNVWFSLHLIWISTNRNVDRCLDKRTKKSRTYHMVQASEHWRALPETKFQERRSFCFRCCGGLQPKRGPVSGLRSFIDSRYHAIVRWLVLKLSSVGCLKEPWDPGGGGTPIYGLYRYVPRNRVWFRGSGSLNRVSFFTLLLLFSRCGPLIG